MAGCAVRPPDPYVKGVALDQSGQHEQAVAEFTKAIELNPHHPAPRNGRAITYINLGAYDSAVADADEAIRLDSRYALAYNTRGAALKAQKKYERAMEDFKRAEYNGPQFSDRNLRWYSAS